MNTIAFTGRISALLELSFHEPFPSEFGERRNVETIVQLESRLSTPIVNFMQYIDHI